ncbi:MAG: amino acid carrier protein [Candidatus Babeliales bacterium]
MTLLSFLSWVNDELLVLPTVLLFFGTGIILTLKTKFVQIRAFPRFIHLLTGGIGRKEGGNTISSFHALFTAMATTIGMGNVVGPSIAIMTGGPGALFWLVMYMFFGSVIKFIAVTFALYTREQTAEGNIIGGPMQYLKLASPFLAQWYSHLVIILFLIWSSLQANTLASILAYERIPQGITGLGLALFIYVVLSGGARRVGSLASKLVPFMFIFYVVFAVSILFKDFNGLKNAIFLVLQSAFSRAAAIGGFAGASVFYAMSSGILRGILITEAGLGTSSIPHAIADTKRPTDQGILAMCSTAADAILSILSGLLILVTGVWIKGEFRSTLIYEAFRLHSPLIGRYVLVLSISLFVITTIMGNGFNGMQSFSVITRYRWIKFYIIFASIVVFFGALMPVPLVWQIADLIMIMIAVPNLLGLLLLTFRKAAILDIKS